MKYQTYLLLLGYISLDSASTKENTEGTGAISKIEERLAVILED